MSTNLSARFVANLVQVYATLRPQALSPVFLSDLKSVYATLPMASEDNLLFLAKRFDKWRKLTEDLVRQRVRSLAHDDPLKCPISLFRTMDAGRLEVAHTRILAWLLNPDAEHGFGTTLLAALLTRISGMDCSHGLRVMQVKTEYPTDSGVKGRLDVLAEGAWEDPSRKGWVLVIEAKIDAGEGEDQLQKYETWLRSKAVGRKIIRIFLTADRRPPETGAVEWEVLSFLDLVRIFRAAYGTLLHAPGFHFLRFYLAGILHDVCHFPRNIEKETADPYALASYLDSVCEASYEGTNHDAAR